MTRGNIVYVFDGQLHCPIPYACVSIEFNGDMGNDQSAGQKALSMVEKVKSIGEFIDAVIKFRYDEFARYDELDHEVFKFVPFSEINHLGGIGDTLTSDFVYIKNMSSVDVVFTNFNGIITQVPAGFFTVIDVCADHIE